MSTAIAKAMWNWAIDYPQRNGGRLLTRDDFTNTWGDLGGATWDWGYTLRQSGVNVNLDQNTWLGTVDQLSNQHQPGGAVGSFYQQPETPGVMGTLGQDMYDWAGSFKQSQNRAPSRADFVQSWGELGGKMADWVNGMGVWPDATSWVSRADNLALTVPPGGAIGFAYQSASTPGQQQQDWYQGYMNKQAEATQAFQNAQIALQQGNQTLASQQLALAQKAQADANTIAQQQLGNQNSQFYSQLGQQNTQFNTQQTGYVNGQATVDRQRIEADIQATKDRIRIAEEQGNAQLALDERRRLDSLQIALGQQGIQEAGVTGYYGSNPTFARQQFEAELRANPRDWVKAWEYQRGLPPPGTGTQQGGRYVPQGGPVTDNGQQVNAQGGFPVPSWLKSVATNTPQAQFQGTSGGLGDFPLKAPDPNQINAKTWNRLNPSEQEGLAGLASSSGFYIPDYIAQMQKSFTKQNTNPTSLWQGF